MLLSLILAWITVIFGIMTSLKYIARVSKSAKCNRFFHKIHIPAGIVLVITGLVHGLLAGNFADAKMSEAYIGAVLFSWNWGTACFIVSILLGITYLLRRTLKKKWMRVHRMLTVCFLILVMIHVADVGIQLPARLFSKQTESAERQDTVKNEVNESAAFSGAVLKDGVYEGSAEGYQDTIKVSVTVENGAVTAIEILEENDTPPYFERAREIIDDILNQQSLQVDVVSGATFSSVGILNAVNDALEAAVEEGELEKNETEISLNRHQKHGERKRKNRNPMFAKEQEVSGKDNEAVGVASFFSGIKALYGKSENELPVKPEDVYMNAQLAEEFAGEKYAAKLYGRIYRQTTDSDKWAVLLHPNQLNGGVIADKIGYIYYELGYNILAPDQRGFGKSGGKLALGCLESMDIYDWLCKLNEDYDPKHIVVHGLSLGGAAVNFLSGIDEFMENGTVKVHELSSLSELHVDGLIVDSSYIDMQQFAGKKYLIRHGTGLTEENVDYYSNAANSLCYAEIPMMVIHGTKDLLVSPDNADKIAACLKTPPRCWKADGEWHVFVLLGKRTEEYREKVQEFLMDLMLQKETEDGHRTVPCPGFTQ